jgi:hypothetical protein
MACAIAIEEIAVAITQVQNILNALLLFRDDATANCSV